MYVSYLCPKCDQSNQSPDLGDVTELRCHHCDWQRSISPQESDAPPKDCLRCGNPDLWRQKNFPQSIGLLFVALAAITSSIAWMYYMPVLAIGILMFFAVIDMVLYIFMPDVLVCYRCQTKHHGIDVSGHATFDHELAEKYRQEKIRLNENLKPAPISDE